MEEKLIQLIDDLRRLNNRAAALGVDINAELNAAARLLNAALDKTIADVIGADISTRGEKQSWQQ
jgi:hypothetical protein